VSASIAIAYLYPLPLLTITSAGAAGNFISPLSALSPNGFKSVIDIDTIGTFNTIKATIPYLVESAKRNPNPSPNGLTGGRILAVSATFHYTGMPLQAHVSAAKAAVDSLMASVSLEYGPWGVTANVVAPGAIEGTEGMERLASQQLEQRERTEGVPSGRWGTVRDIADATVFVFSDAGNYINGTTIVVDGAGWRRQGGIGVGLDANMKYPDFLLSGEISKHLKETRKPKAAKL
jgi:peroxisomal 2,4-dienoyl-CoA reductase